jgi:hypothetical protein
MRNAKINKPSSQIKQHLFVPLDSTLNPDYYTNREHTK